MRVDTINSTVTGGDKPVCIISLGARPVFTLFKLWPSADIRHVCKRGLMFSLMFEYNTSKKAPISTFSL